MPSEKSHYTPAPPIPTYDEATGASSSSRPQWPPSPSLADPTLDRDTETHSLLPHTDRPTRAPAGYQAPYVESDDDGSDWSLEDDDDDSTHEASQVRREMQELEVEDPLYGSASTSSTSWTKRIRLSGFSGFSLPRWKWRWRLPRLTVRLPRRSDTTDASADQNDQNDATSETRLRWRLPGLDSGAAFLLLGRIIALFLVLGFVYLLFMSDLFTSVGKRIGRQFDPEDVRKWVQLNIDPDRMREGLREYTKFPHLAGTEGDYALAMDVHTAFVNSGFDHVSVDEYFVYLNYPKPDGRAVQIMSADGNTPTWNATLEEMNPDSDAKGHSTFAFHGHSKSGDVKGPLIYANYGSRADFKKLVDSGIDTKGAIALVRYYGTQNDRALKVKAAEMAGFAGCIIYSDPADDGFLKGEPAPKGRFMPSDGVQRGAVSLMSWVIGDVLTPGWESTKDTARMTIDQTKGLVKIPSLPISWRDAQVLLQHLKGFGEPVPKKWRGGVPKVEWWTGNSSSPIVRLKNEQDENKMQEIWNIYGKIEGVEQGEKSIMIGNHRDAWAFGATDPNSGTAVMLEVAHVFGMLVSNGWRPLRSIEFMSWDAEEYNMIGSTEFVEKNLKTLQQDGFAYINLDAAISGRDFHAAGSPMFRELIPRVLDRVFDPVANASLRALWEGRQAHLEPLGSGSDYVAFQDMAGTSSLDIRFDGEAHPYHSSYDNFEFMENVGDPGFFYHGLLGQVLGLLILELAERPIMPFDMGNYALSLGRYVHELWDWADKRGINKGKTQKINLEPLKEAAEQVRTAIEQFEKWEPYWEQNIIANGGYEPTGLTARRTDYNSRMAKFETDLLDLEPDGGILNRTQFKHVIFGPQLWSGYDEAYFPAIRDVVEAEDWPLAQSIIDKTANIIKNAATTLVSTS